MYDNDESRISSVIVCGPVVVITYTSIPILYVKFGKVVTGTYNEFIYSD